LRIGAIILAAIILVFWPSVVSAIVLVVVLLLVLGFVALISERPTPPRRITVGVDDGHRMAVRIGAIILILAAIIFVFWPSVVSAIVLAVVLLLVLGFVALISERPKLQDHPGAGPDSPSPNRT
jgi:hypothetical protein